MDPKKPSTIGFQDKEKLNYSTYLSINFLIYNFENDFVESWNSNVTQTEISFLYLVIQILIFIIVNSNVYLHSINNQGLSIGLHQCDTSKIDRLGLNLSNFVWV